MTQQTIFWHDYETWGVDPRRDRAAQFAGIRTDLDLHVIGEPVMFYCKPGPVAQVITAFALMMK